MAPDVGEPRHLLAPGALGILDRQLTVNGRGVCLYEYTGDVVRYFSPSLGGASVPVGSGTDAWREFVHADDRDWLLNLHHNAVADGLGYEALFRFANPDAPPVWVVDRQERTDALADRAWRGISLDVTDLLTPAASRRGNETPLPLAVYCLSHRESAGRPPDDRLRSDVFALPLAESDAVALLPAINRQTTGTTTVTHTTAHGRQRSTLLSWAPFDDDPDSPLIALAVADVTRHRAATGARRRRLQAISQAGGGASFRLVQGGRARVRREWLQQLDPGLTSYSDLLDRARGSQVRRLRLARRTALECREGYCVVLTVNLGGRTQRLAEAGLPDATGAIFDCVLVPLTEPDVDILDELAQLVRGLRLDPAAQLLRSLGHDATVPDLLALLVRVGAHEAHVRRRLSIAQGDDDLGLLARRYSHPLTAPPAP